MFDWRSFALSKRNFGKTSKSSASSAFSVSSASPISCNHDQFSLDFIHYFACKVMQEESHKKGCETALTVARASDCCHPPIRACYSLWHALMLYFRWNMPTANDSEPNALIKLEIYRIYWSSQAIGNNRRIHIRLNVAAYKAEAPPSQPGRPDWSVFSKAPIFSSDNSE